MMGEKMITVPYGDFVDGQKAMADLDSLRAVVQHGGKYIDDKTIKAILGIWEDEKAEE